MTPYTEKYPVGSKVKIAGGGKLDSFYQGWKYHHRLTSVQLAYAEQSTEVETVSFYHGGDVLYQLKGIPGIWHEECLEDRLSQS
jgi:hypothetical protein